VHPDEKAAEDGMHIVLGKWSATFGNAGKIQKPQ
jgi:hypothetical protein